MGVYIGNPFHTGFPGLANPGAGATDPMFVDSGGSLFPHWPNPNLGDPSPYPGGGTVGAAVPTLTDPLSPVVADTAVVGFDPERSVFGEATGYAVAEWRDDNYTVEGYRVGAWFEQVWLFEGADAGHVRVWFGQTGGADGETTTDPITGDPVRYAADYDEVAGQSLRFGVDVVGASGGLLGSWTWENWDAFVAATGWESEAVTPSIAAERSPDGSTLRVSVWAGQGAEAATVFVLGEWSGGVPQGTGLRRVAQYPEPGFWSVPVGFEDSFSWRILSPVWSVHAEWTEFVPAVTFVPWLRHRQRNDHPVRSGRQATSIQRSIRHGGASYW